MSEQEVLADLLRAQASQRRLPDFFIVGHAKCGTTALYQMLANHPQIFMSAVKEPEFLSRAPDHYAKLAAPSGRRRPDTLEGYLALFASAPSEQRAGEASTEYLRTPGTAARIAALRPDARIIAMFREPVSFLRSLHLQLLQVGVETEVDFVRAIDLEPERRNGRHVPGGCEWPPALLYSDHVRYAQQLQEYHQHLDQERVLVRLYDDFRLDNEGVVRQVLRFLDVDDTVELQPTKANPTLRVRSARGERLVNTVAIGAGPVSRVVKGTLKAVLPERLHRGAHRAAVRMVIETEPRPPDPEFVRELQRRFKGEVLAASEYLNEDLISRWGYENVD